MSPLLALTLDGFTQLLIGIGVVLAGIGYGLGSIRQGRNKAIAESYDLALKEIETLKITVERLTEEAAAAAERAAKTDSDLAKARGEIQSLTTMIRSGEPLASAIGDVIHKEIQDGIAMVLEQFND